MRLPNAFPDSGIPEDDAAWTTVPFYNLYFPLRSLSRSAGKDDPERPEAEKYCTLFEDGTAAARIGQVVAVSQGPELPFDVAMTRHRAGRVLAWLKLIRKASERQPAEKIEDVQVAQCENGDYCLRDPQRTHTLVFRSSAGKFPREAFDAARNQEVTIAAVVDRAALAHTTFLAQKYSQTAHVIFTFKKRAGGWRLQVTCPQSAKGNPVTNTLPATVKMDQDPASAEVTCTVNTSHLLMALQRAGSIREVLLTYRGGASLLGAKAFSAHALATPDFLEDEAFFLTSSPAEGGVDEAAEDEGDPASTEESEGE